MHNRHRWVWVLAILASGCDGTPRPYWKSDRGSADSRTVTVYLEDGSTKSATIYKPQYATAGRVTLSPKSGLTIDIAITPGEYRVVGVRLEGSREWIPSYKQLKERQAKEQQVQDQQAK